MPISHASAQARGAIGGLMRAALAPNRSDITAAARGAMWQRFLDQVPPEITDPAERHRRAELIRKAHMRRLALKASVARSKAARARQTAADAKTEAEQAIAEAAAELAQLDGPEAQTA